MTPKQRLFRERKAYVRCKINNKLIANDRMKHCVYDRVLATRATNVMTCY